MYATVTQPLTFEEYDKAEIIANAINQHADELLGAFTVISSKSIRIRKMT
ncbi:MAG: hypothetical protein V7K72_04005 [Nostoc sp.]